MLLKHSICTVLLAVAILPAAATDFKAAPLPGYDSLFYNTNGWIGADGAYSIPLARNKTLWLFSDTWIGAVKDGKRVQPKMINNTIAIQKQGERPQFYYPTNADGQAVSFIEPNEGRGFFWLFAGTSTREGIYFFLRQVEIVNPDSVFGFRGVSTSLAHISNPDDPPAKWKVEQIKFPFDHREDKEQAVMGSAVLKEKGVIYVYGNSSLPGRKGTILARVPERKITSFADWRFFSDGEWKEDFLSATVICPDAPSEGSVFYSPALKRFVYFYTPGLAGKLVVRTAPRPEGPWSEAQSLYDCPEKAISRKVFCYAGKAHPQLSRKRNEFIITYASNSFDVGEVINDARLYFPRFVRVTF